jgi:hypothetical protein
MEEVRIGGGSPGRSRGIRLSILQVAEGLHAANFPQRNWVAIQGNFSRRNWLASSKVISVEIFLAGMHILS